MNSGTLRWRPQADREAARWPARWSARLCNVGERAGTVAGAERLALALQRLGVRARRALAHWQDAVLRLEHQDAPHRLIDAILADAAGVDGATQAVEHIAHRRRVPWPLQQIVPR